MTTFAFMLDTSAVSYALRGEGDVASKIRAHTPSELCVSAITVAELRYGADKRGSPKLHTLIDTFLANVVAKPFGQLEGARYTKLAAELATLGTPIGPFDTLIAAHALALGLTLVTSNMKHFAVVPGLTLQDWR